MVSLKTVQQPYDHSQDLRNNLGKRNNKWSKPNHALHFPLRQLPVHTECRAKGCRSEQKDLPKRLGDELSSQQPHKGGDTELGIKTYNGKGLLEFQWGLHRICALGLRVNKKLTSIQGRLIHLQTSCIPAWF